MVAWPYPSCLVWVNNRVFHENMFFMKRNCSTCSASIWGLLWRNEKDFLILISFRGYTSHFRFDIFYIVDFHSALTLPDRDLRIEDWVKIYNNKTSKRKWLVHPLKLIKIKKSFWFLQSSPQILAEQVEPFLFIKNMFSWNTLVNNPEMYCTQTYKHMLDL